MPEEVNPDFGAMLRQARERRGLSLASLAGATRISLVVLEALERNDISRLPGGIFSRAFVRAYAREVGIDPEDTVRAFIASFPSEDMAAMDAAPKAPLRPAIRFEPGGDLQRTLRRLLAVVVAVGLVVAYLAWSGRLDSWRRAGTATAPVVPVREGAPIAPVAASPPEAQPEGIPPSEEPAVPPSAGDRGLPAAAAVDSPVPPPAAPALPEGVLRLTLVARGRCWVSVRSDGVRVLAVTMEAGEQREVDVGGRISLTTGDAGVFSYAINGLAARRMGAAGQVVTVILTAQNYKTFLQSE